MTDTNLAYIDTEFTNLDPRLGDTIEVAWAINDGPVKALRFLHTLEHASPEALRINGYYDRRFQPWCTDNVLPSAVCGVRQDQIAEFVRDITDATIVAENYGIDCAKLLTKIGFEPWHYRKIELSSVAMTLFNLPRPEGMVRTANRLRELGHSIPAPDHSAIGDVHCLRACYETLRSIRDLTYDTMAEEPHDA